jgi:hypothetical protein
MNIEHSESFGMLPLLFRSSSSDIEGSFCLCLQGQAVTFLGLFHLENKDYDF